MRPSSKFSAPVVKASIGLFAAAALLLAAAHPGQADVRYTMAMQMSDSAVSSGAGAANGPQMRTTTMIKDQREREERTMDMGPYHQDTVTITMCDKRQIVEMDPSLKIYTVSSMDSMGLSPIPMNMGPHPQAPPASQPTGTGKVISTINVKDFGEETLPGIDLPTHHYLLTTRMQSSGCAGDSDTTNKIEMWVAPIKGLDCPERYAPTRTTPAPASGQSGCQTTYEQHGDLAALKDMFMGMPVREKIYQGDRVAMELDMREYSTAALDPSLFDIPSDYKELSRDDYQKAEQQAMMNNMRGSGAPPADNSQPGSTDQQSPGSTPPSGQNNGSQKHHGFHIPLPF